MEIRGARIEVQPGYPEQVWGASPENTSSAQSAPASSATGKSGSAENNSGAGAGAHSDGAVMHYVIKVDRCVLIVGFLCHVICINNCLFETKFLFHTFYIYFHLNFSVLGSTEGARGTPQPRCWTKPRQRRPLLSSLPALLPAAPRAPLPLPAAPPAAVQAPAAVTACRATTSPAMPTRASTSSA